MPTDAKHVPLSKVDRLRQDATEAARVRAYQTHPDVVALRIERIRSQVDTLMWAGIGLGLLFTMTNVQQFAAHGAAVLSLAWLAAWLLDPMVSFVLVGVLRAEQVTARWQVDMTAWVRTTKVFTFASTYTMNTWTSWQALNAAGIVLHSIPPALVYCVAEAAPVVRDRLTEAVLRAAHMAVTVPGTAGAPAAARVSAPDTGQTTTPTEQVRAGAAGTPDWSGRSVEQVDGIEPPAARTEQVDRTPTRPRVAARSGARSTKASGRRSAKSGKPPARTIEQLRTELDAAIEAGEVPAAPSAEQIRTTLRISPDRARQLRDEHRAVPAPRAVRPETDQHATGPDDPTPDSTGLDTEALDDSEVTRDAA